MTQRRVLEISPSASRRLSDRRSVDKDVSTASASVSCDGHAHSRSSEYSDRISSRTFST